MCIRCCVSGMVALSLAPLSTLLLASSLLTPPSLAWHQEGALGEPTPITRVSIPQHEHSEAWGGPGSRYHNGSGFTIGGVGPGPLLLLILTLPYTRQLSQRGGVPGSVTPEWKEWLTLLVLRSRGRCYFPVNQLIELQYSVLLAAAPALPSHSRD